jgi:hypothetical protein
LASKITLALAKECRRLEESCLYTSTSLFIWLRWLRTVRVFLIAASLVCGAIAGWETLAGHEGTKALVAACAFLAGLLPTIGSALKLDKGIEEARRLSGEFKNLQNRFRLAALVSSKKSFEDFNAEVEPLIKRHERARATSATPPEVVFLLARRKVKAGHYTFDLDETEVEEDVAEADGARLSPGPPRALSEAQKHERETEGVHTGEDRDLAVVLPRKTEPKAT